MKIAFFVNGFPSVSETFILDQIVGLLRRGHDVDIHARTQGDGVTSVQHADIERYRLLNRVRYQTLLPHSRWRRLGSALLRMAGWACKNPGAAADSVNVLRYGRSVVHPNVLNELIAAGNLQSTSYDIIHSHFGPNGQRAVAWRNFGVLRGPIVTSFHGYDVNQLPRTYGPGLYKRLFRQGDLFTIGSEFLRSRLIELGAPEDRIAKLPMGIDLSRFEFSERTKSIDGALRLLTVARLVEVKGIEYALRAVAAVKDKYPGIRYQIVGDGPLRNDLETLSNRFGIADKVEFFGALSRQEIIEKLRSAHVFMLPSVVTVSGEEEGQSVVLAEAQACGLPVIATRTGGIPESILEGESGLLVPPRDSEALKSSILWFAVHPDVWGRMGRAGRAHVEANFNLERLNDELVKIYHRVIRDESGRGHPQSGERA